MASSIREIGSGRAAESFEQILADRETDIVSIASYDALHPAQVQAAFANKKHVFCEKPLCRTLDELRTVRDAWKTSGRALACNLVLRGAPLYQWARAAVESGELGEVYAFDGDYLYGRMHKITEGWRSEEQDYSVMLGGGVHLVDLMTWITGQRPDTVTSIGNKIATRDTKFRYKDFAAATFEFSSGLIGRITANFGCVHKHHHVVRIFGTKATFIYDDRGPRIHRSRDEDAVSIDQAPLPPGKGVLIPDFVRAIHEGARLSERTQHEFDLVSMCIAADASMTSGVKTRIEYV